MSFLGKHHKEESVEKCRIAKIGSKNPMWKGETVGYKSLHEYIRSHLPKNDKCQCCGAIKKLEVANISQKYKRGLDDWEWLCRKCHMTKDGRLEKLHQKKKNKNSLHSHPHQSCPQGILWRGAE